MVSPESWRGPGFLEDLCLWLMITVLQNRKGDTVRGRHFTQLQGSQKWSQFLLCCSSKELGYTGKQTSKSQPWSHINKNTKIHLVFLIICDPTESRPVYFSEQHGRRESGNNSDMHSLFIPLCFEHLSFSHLNLQHQYNFNYFSQDLVIHYLLHKWQDSVSIRICCFKSKT